MTNAKRIRRESTPAERKEYEQLLKRVEQDREEILARGRELKREHDELLRHVMGLLNNARQSGDLSLADLKDRTGIDRSTLSKLLNDPSSNPTLMTLNRLATALGKRLVVKLEDR
jgi:DNA-binding phage protein